MDGSILPKDQLCVLRHSDPHATYPSGQVKLSSGLTSCIMDFATKLPSKKTLVGPDNSVYSDVFLILVCH